MWIVVGCLALYIGLMMSGKASFALTSVTVLSILMLTGVLSVGDGLAAFATESVLIIATMFPLSYLFQRTSLIDGAKRYIINLSKKGNKSQVIAILMIVCAAGLMQLLTSTALVVTIILGFLTSLSDDNSDVTMTRMLLPLTAVVLMWQGRIPVSPVAISQFAKMNLRLEAGGIVDYAVNMGDNMKCTLVPTILFTLFTIFTYKWLPTKPSHAAKGYKAAEDKVTELLPKNQQIFVYIAFFGSIIGMALVGVIGKIAYTIPLFANIVMIWMKIIEPKKVLRLSLDGPVIGTVAIIGVCSAISTCGLGDLIGQGVMNLLGESPSGWTMMIAIAALSFLITSFSSNNVATQVCMVLIVSVCKVSGYDPRGLMICALFCSHVSWLTPMASIPAAIAYPASGLTVKDTLKWSLVGSAVCVVSVVINAMLVFPPVV